jgi:acetyltransferase-like isoleucine patch superfamily enzyme
VSAADAPPPAPDRRPEPTKLDADLFIRQKLHGAKRSKIRTYRDLVTGDAGLVKWLWYELLTTVVGPLGGALGHGLRALTYRSLFGAAGKGLVVGRSVTIRHPDRIRIGRGVVIDDYCLIDGRGAGEDGIVIGDDVLIHRGAIIIAKAGGIEIGDRTNVGTGSLVVSMGGVSIGADVGIGGGCSISGGAFQVQVESERGHDKYTKGPVRLGDRSWFGMRAIVLDGVTVGDGCIVGAGSVVNRDLPADSVATGMPVKVVRTREPAST